MRPVTAVWTSFPATFPLVLWDPASLGFKLFLSKIFVLAVPSSRMLFPSILKAHPFPVNPLLSGAS